MTFSISGLRRVAPLAVFVFLAGCASSDSAADTTVVVATDSTEASSEATPSDTVFDTEATENLVDATDPSSDTVSNETVESDTSASDSSAAGSDEVAVATLADDDPTCVAIREVKELNDSTGALTNDLTTKLIGAATSGDQAAIDRDFEKFLDDFAKQSETMMPKLSGAYDSLAKEQPQFAKDLEGLESVTVKLLAAFRKMKATDLENFEGFLAAEVPVEEMMSGGLASLKIDKFSRAACDLPFANT